MAIQVICPIFVLRGNFAGNQKTKIMDYLITMRIVLEDGFELNYKKTLEETDFSDVSFRVNDFLKVLRRQHPYFLGVTVRVAQALPGALAYDHRYFAQIDNTVKDVRDNMKVIRGQGLQPDDLMCWREA